MKDRKIPSLYLIPAAIIGMLILFLVVGILYVCIGYSSIAKEQLSKKPYEEYGIELPNCFNCVFRYESPSDGFHGDKCIAVKYKTDGESEIFVDFKSDTDLTAESELDFVMDYAKVPDNLRPNYSEGYYWKSFSADDWGKKLIVFWFPEQESAYFGEVVT